MAELENRVALVTGASRGIGAATARALAAAGARVILTDTADTSALARELDGLARHQDVTNEADWVETVAFARREAGGLDILVNNAGVFTRLGPITEIKLEEWRRVHAVNVEGVFLGCKHAVPLLAERASRWAGGYTMHFPFGDVTGSATYAFIDSQYYSIFNNSGFLAPSYYNLDLRLLYQPPGGRWTFILYGRNVTDQLQIINYSTGDFRYGPANLVTAPAAFPTSGQVTYYTNPPRVFGAEVQLRF